MSLLKSIEIVQKNPTIFYFDCLGENTEKYITFSVPLKKKIENKNLEITYKIKFIDSFRFMSSSLS